MRESMIKNIVHKFYSSSTLLKGENLSENEQDKTVCKFHIKKFSDNIIDTKYLWF